MAHGRRSINRTGIGSLVAIAGMVVMAGLGYPRLPPTMPIHFSVGGPSDGLETVSRPVGVLAVPIVALTTIGLFWLVPRLNGVPRSLESSRLSRSLLVVLLASLTVVQFLLVGLNAGWL